MVLADIKPIKQRKLTSRTKLKLAAGICLIAIAALAFHLVQAKPASTKMRPGSVTPDVRVVSLTKSDLLKKIQLTGKTVPEAQVDIAAKYTGKIREVNVELGQSVVPGQILLVQDTNDIDAALAQNTAVLRGANADAMQSNASFQASYQKAQADYNRTMINYQRYKSLYETGAVSKEALDNVEQQMTAAKAELDTWSNQLVAGSAASVVSKQAAMEKAQASIEALAQQRSDMIIRAPRAGVIGYRQAEVGNLAQAGQKLLSIVDNSKIYVDCAVAEQDIGQMRLGMPAEIKVDALGKTYNGKIIYISPSMDSSTQVFTIRLALEGADVSLKAGMFARTDMTVTLRQQTLSVPKEAVISLNGKDRVFVIDANNQAQERIVQLGFRTDSSIEIVDGVKEGDKVAITNLARLKTGTTVTITQ